MKQVKPHRLIPLIAVLVSTSLACWSTVPPTPQSEPTSSSTASLNFQHPTPSKAPTLPATPNGSQDEGGLIAVLPDVESASFSDTELKKWRPPEEVSTPYSLPVKLTEIKNHAVTSGLTATQKRMLENQGFTVIHSQEDHFSDIREQVSKIHGQPYFLTADAAYHALHQNFSELLKSLEREYLFPSLQELTLEMLASTEELLEVTRGTELEKDGLIAVAFFGVPARLLGLDLELDPQVEQLVELQLAQIESAESGVESVVVPAFKDDYGAYKPTGHYAGDADLESYFQAMTWYGRNHYLIEHPEPDFLPSRAPLIITMAMREAHQQGKLDTGWSELKSVISFLIGPDDDLGPRDYSLLINQVYGPTATILDLKDNGRWETFQTLVQTLPLPQINSTFAASLHNLDAERGWRFLGQRFTIDSFIMQNLVFDRVGTTTDRRMLPSGLDVMGVLDSPAAYRALEQGGHIDYANYKEQFSKLQQIYKFQDEPAWLENASSAWLYSFMPLLDLKTDPFPAFMHSPEWNTRELNTALGSWAELKHDTALYTKSPEAAAGGGPPSSGPAPGYVEPNPLVFYRLAFIARAIGEGLLASEMVGHVGESESATRIHVQDMQWLGERFEQIGDIAAKELNGEKLDDDDYRIIQSPIGNIEDDVMRSRRGNPHGVGDEYNLPDVPVIAAVAGAGSQVLEVGTGKVDRLYVVVPIDGSPQIAQGGVYSYYEFPHPRADRLTDLQWRMLLESEPPELPAWATDFILPYGNPVDELAFRTGDIYMITLEGENLNLRLEPSRSSETIKKLLPGEYIKIIGGPVEADGFTWLQLQNDFHAESPIEGWAVQNQDWYERAWGQ